MTSGELLRCFDSWRQTGEPLVLACVYDTEGSTYSKAGAQMLINAQGDFQGMLSGGCLEGDLAERARRVSESGRPQVVTYDLAQDDDALWGLGVGCDGLMRIILLPLVAANGYEPFAAIAGVLSGDEAEVAAIVIDSTGGACGAGASLVTSAAATACIDMPEPVAGVILNAAIEARNASRSQLVTLAVDDASLTVLFALLQPPPRILILGGGLDAGPVLRLASEQGWRVTVQDHRPAYIEKGDFTGAENVLCVPAQELASHLDLSKFDAAVVMSHHLDSDREYLRALAAFELSYVGLLGPPHRRRRLLQELGPDAEPLRGCLHGPAGIDIGGSGPASIALSIVAQMHAVLCRESESGD